MFNKFFLKFKLFFLNTESKSTFFDFFISYLFFFLAVPFSYILRVFFGRVFSVEEYGFFYSMIAFIGLISFISDFGISESVVYFFSKFKANKNFRNISKLIFFSYFFIFFTSLFSITFLYFFRKDIFVYFLKVNFFYYEKVFVLFLLYTILLNFSNLMINFFRALNITFFYSSFQFLRQIFTLILLSISFFIFNINSFFFLSFIWVFSYITITFIYTMVLFYLFYKKKLISFSKNTLFDFSFLKEIFSYSIFLSFTLAIGNLMMYTDQFFIVLLSSVKENGFYNVVYPTANFVVLFFQPLSFVIFPLFSKYYHEKKIFEVKKLFYSILNFGFIITVPILVLLSFFSKEIIFLLFGQKYAHVFLGVIILNFGFFFYGIATILLNYFAASGKIKTRLKILFFVLLFNILFDFVLIPIYGYLGAAVATSFGFFILLFLSFFLVNKELNLNIDYFRIFKIFFLNIIFLIFLILLKNIALKLVLKSLFLKTIFIIFPALTFYFILVFYFKILSFKDIQNFLKELNFKK